MNTIANLWYIWLAGALISYIIAFLNQAKRMKRMMSMDFEQSFNGFSGGIVWLFLSGISGTVFSALLVISVALNVISYFAH
jgi:hypothetical protein